MPMTMDVIIIVQSLNIIANYDFFFNICLLYAPELEDLS